MSTTTRALAAKTRDAVDRAGHQPLRFSQERVLKVLRIFFGRKGQHHRSSTPYQCSSFAVFETRFTIKIPLSPSVRHCTSTSIAATTYVVSLPL